MVGRVRAMWATATSTPWRRAPLLLWRRPGVLAAVAGACAVMAAAVAAVPLFLSSAGTASVGLQAEERCPRDTGVTRAAATATAALTAPIADPFAPLHGELTATNTWVARELIDLGETRTAILAREGAADHVAVLDGPRGEGIWIPDRAAEMTGLGVGDRTTLGGAPVTVAAIYRDVAGFSVDRFWCSNADLLLVEDRGGDLVLPPPLVLADRETVAAVLRRQGLDRVVVFSEAGLRDDLTLAEADQLIHDLACNGRYADELAWCEEGQPMLTPRTGGFSRDPLPARSDGHFVERFFRSSLPFVTARSRAIQTSVGSGIWPVAAFAALAGAGLVAAAASLWFDRRRREVQLLSVRGVSPVGLGLKAVLELAIPMVAGAAAGIGLAYVLVVAFGPAPELEPAAVGRAAWAAAAALAGAALTVAAVVTARVKLDGTPRRRSFRLGAVPWELALVALTVVSYRRLGEWGLPVGRGAQVSKVDVLGLLFPVLFLVSVVAVISRLLALGVRPLRAVSRTWRAELYLAVRRVARARTAALGLVAASAVAVGVLVYAATMDRSLNTTLQAKATTFVGTDMAARLHAGEHVPAELTDRTTEVEVIVDAYLVDDDGRESVTVLAIDPDTFADIAFWDDTFSGTSLETIVERLTAPSDDGALPAVLVGIDVGGPVEAVIGDGDAVETTLVPVAEVETFPGMKRGKVTVFVSAEALGEVVGGRAEAWIEGDRDAAVAALAEAGLQFVETRRVDEVVDGSSFVTVSWTFGFMRSLGLSAGVLALGGVAVHLDARRRERVLGHAFLRRMGLGARQHRRALFVELVASVLVGCWVGIAAAVTCAWLAHGRVDPVPGLRPDPLLRPSLSVIAATAIGSIVVVVLAAALAQRRAEHDDPVEVLRAGA